MVRACPFSRSIGTASRKASSVMAATADQIEAATGQ